MRRKPGLSPVGVSRSLPEGLYASGEWSTSSQGEDVWRVSLRSEGAEAIRVRFEDFHVGSGKVWVLGTDVDGGPISIGPYSGDGPHGDGRFWSDLVASETALVAYEPGTAPVTDIPFKLAQVSHRFGRVDASAGVKAADGTKAASASCTVDASCHPEYSEPASAVAFMIFESEGESYQCSGALISSASQPLLPFFLTANHCIANAEEAKSLVAVFNYQTSSCNGTKPSLSRSPRVTGSTFVVGGALALGDFTLLRLSSFPDVDVKVLGWAANEIAANQQVTSISHPAGDTKRIAFGQRGRDASIRFGDGTRMPANRGYQVTWFEGVTQGGSSGSPLLAKIDGRDYVVGTLTGGPDIDEDNDELVCRASNTIGSYGRFSTAFLDLQPFLTTIDGGGSVSPTANNGVSFNASQLPASATAGVVALSWQASGYSRVQIRVGSPTGVAMTGIEGSTGTVQSGDWATEGLTFFLQNAADGDSSGASKTIATVRVQRAGASAQRSGEIGISPGLIFTSGGRTAGSATIAWRATGVSRVQIRVGSPTGTPMTGLEMPEGLATTGPWVTNGLTFFLQDASDGNSSGSSKTLGWVTAQVLAR